MTAPLTAKQKHELLRFVAQQALRNLDTLSLKDRAKLFRGLSLFLPSKDARAAAHTAWLLKQTDEAQFKVFETLLPVSTNNQPGGTHD